MMVPIDSTAHHHSGSNSRKWAGSNEILAVPSLGRDSGIAGRQMPKKYIGFTLHHPHRAWRMLQLFACAWVTRAR